MTLLDDIRSNVRRPGGRCTVGLWIADHPEHAADLAAAFDDPNVTVVAIHSALKARGASVGIEGLRRHARRVCQCTDDDRAGRGPTSG